jgi:hypothetical protein
MVAPAHAQLVDVAHFADPISARSAALSPDGAHVAYIRRTDADEQIIVIDLANRAGRAIQRITTQEGAYLWVGWKNNTRLLIGAELTQVVEGRTRRGSHVFSADREVSTASVLALNRDGTGFVQMFGDQIRRSLRGSTSLLDPLSNDAEGVLLIAEDNAGLGVWRADVNTGRAERVARGPDETIGYVTDGAGYPVIRIDGLSDYSGFRIFRRANGAEDWTMALEARRAAAAQASADFNVVAPGPGPNQVYVLARNQGARPRRPLSLRHLHRRARRAHVHAAAGRCGRAMAQSDHARPDCGVRVRAAPDVPCRRRQHAEPAQCGRGVLPAGGDGARHRHVGGLEQVAA